MIANEDVDPYSSASDAQLSFDMEWNTQFHGVAYLVNVRVDGSLLSIDAEHLETNQRWSAEFTSQYIEEITLKAGNYKKFTIFAKMLRSALSKDAESLFIDLLTYSDLESLKAKKMGNTSVLSEYDRVHYPLPLSFEEVPNVEALKRTIRRLRAQTERPKEDTNRSIIDGNIDPELRSAITQLRLENTELKHRVRLLQSRTGKPDAAAAGTEANTAYSKLKREFDAVKKQLAEVSTAYSALRKQTREQQVRERGGIGGAQDRFKRELSEVQRQLKETQRLKSAAYNPYMAASARRRALEEEAERVAHTGRRGAPVSSRRGASDDEAYRAASARRRGFEPERTSSPYRYPQTRERAGSPSSRFDPTAYQSLRRQQLEQSRHSERAWSAGPRRDSFTRSPQRGESGYMSASSQSSKGSVRSASSKGSRQSQRAPSPSVDDRGKSKKKEARPPLPRSERPPQARPSDLSYQELKRQAKAIAESAPVPAEPRGSKFTKRVPSASSTKENVAVPPSQDSFNTTSAFTVRPAVKKEPAGVLSRSLESVDSNRSSVKDRTEEISDIDKRILALRSYLDNARNGIIEEK